MYARARGDASPKDDCSAVCTRCSYLHASSQIGAHARELSVNPSHDRHDVAERAEERAPQRRAGTCLPRETDAREGVFACARRAERIGSLLPRSGRTPSTPPGAIKVAIWRRRATERRRIPECCERNAECDGDGSLTSTLPSEIRLDSAPPRLGTTRVSCLPWRPARTPAAPR